MGTAELGEDSRAQWAQAHTMSQDSVLAWCNPEPFPFLRLWVPEPGTFLGQQRYKRCSGEQQPSCQRCSSAMCPLPLLPRVVPGSMDPG